MRPHLQRMVVAWLVALVTGGMAFALAEAAHRLVPRTNPLEELSYYPSGQHLRAAVFGQDEAAADLAWLRAVQYYGEHRTTDNRFERMPHVFDILTTLAPGFLSPHVFGAFAMAQEGGDFTEAERLMQKGLEANPKSGRLAFEMGFLYYVRPGGRDLTHAAEYFEQAARQVDAPPASARFAAFARERSGNLSVAYELWSEVRNETKNRYLREIAERNLAEIRTAIGHGRPAVEEAPLPTPRVVFGRKP
jgi:hypothetical protein